MRTNKNKRERTRTNENKREQTRTKENRQEWTWTNKNERKQTRMNENEQEHTRTNENKREQTRTNKNKREQTRTNENEWERTKTNENKRDRTRTNENDRLVAPWYKAGKLVTDRPTLRKSPLTVSPQNGAATDASFMSTQLSGGDFQGLSFHHWTSDWKEEGRWKIEGARWKMDE